MQHEPSLRDDLTYVSPSSGERVGLRSSSHAPTRICARRTAMMKRWADFSGGMMGRTPDYLNVGLTAFSAAASFFAQGDPRHGPNIQNYYEHVRENDLCMTHTLIKPQANRSVGPSQQADPFMLARVVKETDAGLVIRGARMLATLGPLADEIEVFPSHRAARQRRRHSLRLWLLYPGRQPGLKFICRETFDYGRSAIRPSARVALRGDGRGRHLRRRVGALGARLPLRRLRLCNGAFAETNAVVHMAHQVIVKNIAKTEFVFGLAALIVDRSPSRRSSTCRRRSPRSFWASRPCAPSCGPRSRRQLDRWGIDDAVVRAARRRAQSVPEALSAHDRDHPATRRQRTDGHADRSRHSQPDRTDDRQVSSGRARDACNRIALFRLAWDMALCAFGSRQVLYERFFFGDPVRMASALYTSYDKEPYKRRVQAFLDRPDQATSPQLGH